MWAAKKILQLKTLTKILHRFCLSLSIFDFILSNASFVLLFWWSFADVHRNWLLHLFLCPKIPQGWLRFYVIPGNNTHCFSFMVSKLKTNHYLKQKLCLPRIWFRMILTNNDLLGCFYLRIVDNVNLSIAWICRVLCEGCPMVAQPARHPSYFQETLL